VGNKACVADSLAFLGFPGEPIRVEEGIVLDLAHLTAVPPWVKAMEESLAHLRSFRAEVEAHPRLVLIRKGSEIAPAFAAGKISVVLGMQHLPDDASPSDIALLKGEGISIVALAYADDTLFGSGWRNPEDLLTTHGHRMLMECARHGVIVDISHAGHGTARGIVNARLSNNLPFELNLMASHGGCHAVYPHLRNLPDDVLEGIAETRGIVGITTLTFLLHGESDETRPFFEHLGHAVTICGPDAVAIGSDAPYVEQNEEEARDRFERMKAQLDPDGSYGARFPDHPWELNLPNRMDSLFAELALRKAAQEGNPAFPFRDGDASRIFGENFRAFLERALV